MVHGYNYGAKYIIEFNKSINWFDIFPDIMKLTQIVFPIPDLTHKVFKNNTFPMVEKVFITDFINKNKTDIENETIKDLFYKFKKNAETYINTFTNLDDELEIYLMEETKNIEQIETLLNTDEIVPFVLSGAHKQAIDFICNYCFVHDIQIIKKGWNFASCIY